MPKGKPWTREGEAELKQMVESKESIETIAARFGKTKEAIREKCKRLGLKVVIQRHSAKTTTSIPIPMELPSAEEALKILAGALKAAAEPDLEKVEVQRLHVVATLAKTYKELLADYINYRAIEAKLLEMEEKYAQLAEKAEGDASKPNTAQMVQPPAK